MMKSAATWIASTSASHRDACGEHGLGVRRAQLLGLERELLEEPERRAERLARRARVRQSLLDRLPHVLAERVRRDRAVGLRSERALVERRDERRRRARARRRSSPTGRASPARARRSTAARRSRAGSGASSGRRAARRRGAPDRVEHRASPARDRSSRQCSLTAAPGAGVAPLEPGGDGRRDRQLEDRRPPSSPRPVSASMSLVRDPVCVASALCRDSRRAPREPDDRAGRLPEPSYASES